MATFGDMYMDLVDVFQQEGRGQGMIDLINMMYVDQPILEDAVVTKCNDGSKHRTQMVTGLTDGEWMSLYEGVIPSKSNRIETIDVTGFYQAASEVDTRVQDYSNNLKLLRYREAKIHMNSMAQAIGKGVWYANSDIDSKQFMGFTPRFNKLSGDITSSQVIDAGGASTASNTSIWFITFGDEMSSLLYPSTSMAGLQRTDHGIVPVNDAKGGRYFAYSETFKWDVGLSIRDWRYVVRICNIDVASLEDGTFDIYKYLSKAYWKHHGRFKKAGNSYIYGNSLVMEALDRAAINQGGSDKYIRLRPGMDIQGKEVNMYRGFPVRETQQLLNTEGRVS